MGLQIGLSLIFDKGKELLIDEGLCFWMYIYLYWSPLTFIHVCDCSGGVFLWLPFAYMYTDPLKGQFYSVTSCCINSSLTPLLLSPHPRKFSFMYRIENTLCIWKDMGWYCWLGFLCWCCWPVFLCWYCCIVVLWWYFWLKFLLVCWQLFGTFWWWNVFTNLLLKMGSIIEWYGLMSMSAVSRVSKISSIEGNNMIDSWLLCGWRSNLLTYSSKEVMYIWRCFRFDSSMVYFTVRFLICTAWSLINTSSLLIARDLSWEYGRDSTSPRQKAITRS